MLIKITDKCTMGCTHCLSDCTEKGEHMTFEMFKEAIAFNNSLPSHMISPLLISGGEPFEHPEIEKFIDYLIQVCNDEKDKSFPLLQLIDTPKAIITTNGDWISKHPDYVRYIYNATKEIWFQVVIDDRYYPIHVDEESLKVHPNVKVCYGVQSIYPQGRAITNNLEHNRKSSSCFNVRALAKQIGSGPMTLDKIITSIFLKGHLSCCPHVDINGKIKVGESRLCPVCSDIHKSTTEIVDDIIAFRCSQCDFINSKLPPEYRKFVE